MKCYLFESEGKVYTTYGETQFDAEEQFFQEWGIYPESCQEVDVNTIVDKIELKDIIYF